MRKIIHVDMDAFYASVEQRDRPELRGKPVVVGGTPDGRGVVAAASYEARRYGIHSAMPAARAKRLCPHAIFLSSSFDKYTEVSRQIRDVFHEVTDLVEPLSLDEAFLDVTENFLGEPLAGKVARHIKERIKTETGLTASAGVGPSKLIAKLASDWDKPDGLVIIPPERVEAFLTPLPVGRLWGVGPKTAERLADIGIRTVEDVRSASRDQLERTLGRFGPFLFDLAHGRDDREVLPHRIAKSRGAERTLAKDLIERSEVEALVDSLSERVAEALARTDRPGRTITLKIRYDDFTTITRSRSVPSPTKEAARIASVARQLLDQTEVGRRPVRLVGVSVGHLIQEGEPHQLELDLVELDQG